MSFSWGCDFAHIPLVVLHSYSIITLRSETVCYVVPKQWGLQWLGSRNHCNDYSDKDDQSGNGKDKCL